jgi:hypothetical protein
MSTQAKTGAGEALTSDICFPRVVFASIWTYALAWGFLAYGLTDTIAAVTHPGNVRLLLQLGTIPVTAVVAGLACKRTLSTFYAHRLLPAKLKARP